MGDRTSLRANTRVFPVFRSKEFGNATTGNQTGLPQMGSVDLFGNLWVSVAKFEDFQWSISSTPEAGKHAKVTFPPSRTRHIAKTISCTINATAFQEPQILVLRDGPSGKGEILWSQRLGPVEMEKCFAMTWNVAIETKYPNTEMCLEFLTEPNSDNYNSVALTGYDTDY